MNDFFAQFFELWRAAESTISGELLDFGIYQNVGIAVLLLSFFFPLLFYKLIDSPHFCKLKNWFTMLTIPTVLMALIAVFYPMSTFSYEGIEGYSLGDYLTFMGTTMLWTIVLFFFFSLIFKIFSTNAKRVPF